MAGQKKSDVSLSQIISSLRRISYPKLVGAGFIIVIIAGALLLMLPCASRNGEVTPFQDTLFTATSATCVTGLVVYDTYTQWSKFGQIVILCLIQTGGLGFISILAMFSLVFKKRIGLRGRNILQESVNTMKLSGVIRMMKKVLIGTFMFEGIGAFLLSFRFIPKMGLKSGLFSSVFLSISAFCNAGFDLNGRYGQYSSLVEFDNDILVNVTVMLLILIGSIGFFVWDDISVNKLHFKRYQLHSKIALSTTIGMTLIGAVLFYIFEQDATIAGMTQGDGILASFFSSVTPRTAGFNTVDTAQLTPASKLLTIIYMFVGGSPGSTAGGAKTTTIVVMIAAAWANLRNSEDCNIFNRRLEADALKKAASVITINLLLMMTAIVSISAMQSNLSLTDVTFEVFSALDTVGMTTGITRDLNSVSRLIITFLMFCGRVGSVSFALVFVENRKYVSIKNPIEKINIG